MIKSINLVDWRSHENTKVEFGYGTNLLVGIMGSGKTSILDGISYALFGTFPALERRRLKLEDIPRYGSAYSKVVLSFAWNGSDYIVERKIENRNGKIFSKADIYRDNTHLESGATAVTGLVEEILDVDYDLFTRAIYSEQNNIDYFLSLDPRRRKDEFDRILGLDRFEKARAGTVTLSNRLESVAASLADKYSVETEKELRKLVSDALEKEQMLEKETERLEAELAAVRERLKGFASSFEAAEKNRKQKEALEREIAMLRGRISTFEGVKEVDAEAYRQKKEKLAKIKSRLDEIRAALNAEKKKESEWNSKLLFVENKIREYARREEELKKYGEALAKLLGGRKETELRDELERMRGELERISAEKAALAQFAGQIKDMLVHLVPGSSTCPLCESELGAEGIAKVRKKKEEELRRAEQKIKALLEQMAGFQKGIASMEELLKKIELTGQRIALVRQQLPAHETLETEKSAAMAALARLRKEIMEKEQDEKKTQGEVEPLLLEIKAMEEMMKRAAMLKEARERLLRAEKLHSEVRFDETEYLSLRKNVEEGRIEEQKIMSQLDYSKKEKSLLAQNRSAYGRQLADILSFKEKAEIMRQVVEELKIYKNALLETQVELRKELIDAINTAMNEIWGIFYPYGNYKALRVDVSEKDYTFVVLENDQWKPLESVASGGERACAALTLRVALAMVLTPNLSWLILDEPTHNLDFQAIALLSETLQTKVPQVVKQVFVITHEEALIGADFSRAYKLSRDKDAGGATKVEML